MPELIPVLNRDEIKFKVEKMAEKISSDYKNSELVLIGVLKGAFIFLSDLARNISVPVEIDFIGASSYGSQTSSSGEIRLTKEISVDVKNKDVLLVEDIIDTGLTLNYLIEHIRSFKPKSVKVCVFIDKQERRETEIKVDYVCHTMGKGFIVGYGLDFNERYRNLPDICHLKF